MSNEATRAQIDAAHPKRSTWLSANAGSGKTRVLTDRVALLLLDGVLPQRVLCLTYTKAAASEMQNRLFKRLGAWAMMDRDKLTASLTELGVAPGDVTSKKLREARRLFAKAIETPGGLKIQTIHSFCAALLRRFPLEADVSPAFQEMDDRATKQLREAVLDEVSVTRPDLLKPFAEQFTAEDPDSLLADISRNADWFAGQPSDAELHRLFGLPEGTTEQSIVDQVLLGDEGQLFADMMPFLEQGKDSDQKLARQLIALGPSVPSLSFLAQLEDICLTKAKAANPFSPNATPTKDVAAAMGDLSEAYQALKTRVADARHLRLALRSYSRTKTLHAFAHRFLTELARAKQSRGWLDFDDLIRRARQLLTDPEVADWVLFRLDGGIDHILVDEAQDTSPAQWDVIKLLAKEFTSGDGVPKEGHRTLFVVGDKKQSIYSFQGADPAEFDRMCADFESKFEAIQAPFGRRELLYSFRSATPILDLVDKVFTHDLRQGMGDPLRHKAFKDTLPGRVDLWHWIEGDEAEDEKDWFDPVDTVGKAHHSVVLADEIADHIHHQITHGQITQIVREDGIDHLRTRPIQARDFLILVQSRTGQAQLFHEIIRACKSRNLPMAGADRLRVGAELGVRDLISLLSFLETPQDDLSLAEVMRSPLGNLSERDLYDLAQGRDGTLWASFDARKSDHPHLHEMLSDLRAQAEFMRPFDLLERALTYHHGRARLLSRLGVEAEEGIAALLDQALHYEQTEAPTLTGFLSWLATDDVTIKRQIDSEGDFIRVMTVHGAKGLEAPIVILPQTGAMTNTVRDDILNADGTAIWKAKSGDATVLQTRLTDAQKELQNQERMRLLYVALTRAESHLIVCGSGKAPAKGETWYEMVEAGLTRTDAVAGEGRIKLRLDYMTWPEDTDTRALDVATELEPLPSWAVNIAPAPTARPVALSPSDLGGAKVIAGPTETLSEADAMARGTVIHLLLEQLSKHPRSDRKTISNNILEGHDTLEKQDLFAHAERVLDAPELQFLFDGNALSEVAISAQLAELQGHHISGAIDRLLIEPDRILAVDFKSNHRVPTRPEDTPEGILRQMGAYRAALAQIYPDRRIETAIIWTETAEFMPLPHDIVRDALSRAHIS